MSPGAKRRLAAMLPIALAVAGAGAAGAQESDHDEHAHHFVRITDDRLTPRVVEMHSGDAIAWGNYTRKTVRIAFDREVAKRIVCESPGSFRLTDDALASRPLRMLQFASLCRLAPGDYEYEVTLRAVTQGVVPAHPLKGHIRVAE